jgi:hypothetical protein
MYPMTIVYEQNCAAIQASCLLCVAIFSLKNSIETYVYSHFNIGQEAFKYVGKVRNIRIKLLEQNLFRDSNVV